MITITLVFALVFIGYAGSRWLKHALYDVISAELVHAGIFNVSIEGVSVRWLGVDVQSLLFDVEKAGYRHSISLSGISLQGSLASIQQRRIQHLGIDKLVVTVERIESQPTDKSVNVRQVPPPIPSDLFLLLPSSSVEIQKYSVQHTHNLWHMQSDSGVIIKQERLLTDFTFSYPELPEIKATLELNAKNHVILNVAPSLMKGGVSIHPALMKLEGSINGHYKQFTTSIVIEVDLKETIDHSAFVQEQIANLVGNDVFVTKGALYMTADMTVDVDNMSSVQGRGKLQLNDINVKGQGKSLSGLNGSLNVGIDGSALSFSSKDIVMNKVSSGVSLHTIESSFNGTFDVKKKAYQINVSTIDGRVMGGEMSLLPFTLTGPELTSDIEVQLTNIGLHQLLALQSNQDLSGEGKLSGFVQVSINPMSIEIYDGHFSSENGHIRYRRNSVADAVSASRSQQQLAFVYDAMEDFQYTSLETDVILKAPDNLFLGIALKGSNPNVKQGQKLNLNLNLEQNIGPLIQAASIDSALQNNLLKQ